MGGRKHALPELLGRLFHQGRGAEIDLVVRHRGAAEDRKVVRGGEIARVTGRLVALADGSELPLHRVLELRVAGEVVWRRPPRGVTAQRR